DKKLKINCASQIVTNDYVQEQENKMKRPYSDSEGSIDFFEICGKLEGRAKAPAWNALDTICTIGHFPPFAAMDLLFHSHSFFVCLLPPLFYCSFSTVITLGTRKSRL